MKIVANNLSKRFNREWIIKNFSFEFCSGKTYAITGPNGSGKSTLLQLLWGQMLQSSGTIRYWHKNKEISIAEIFNSITIATPYMDLIDEFTLEEMVQFHFRCKPSRQGKTNQEIINLLELSHAKKKPIADFSSGMRQRLKLGLTFFTDAEIVFLDEPTTNLDKKSINWYWQHLSQLPPSTLLLIASNQEAEFPPSAEKIDILGYK